MLSRRECFLILREKWSRSEREECLHVLAYAERLRGTETNVEERKEALKTIRVESFYISKKWQQAHRKLAAFLSYNRNWLDAEVTFFPNKTKESSSSSLTGRPCNSFDTLSQRSKRRRTETLRATASVTELCSATATSLRADGNRMAAKVVEHALRTPGEVMAPKRNPNEVQEASYSPQEALSLVVEAKPSKEQYRLLRNGAQRKGSPNLYPSYFKNRQAKAECYPPEDAILVTESCAEVDLQHLLDLTFERLCTLQWPVLSTLCLDQSHKMVMVGKWEADGFSGLSLYKQIVPHETFSDSSIFATSYVPLQLYTLNNRSQKIVIRQNPKSSSPRYCRPIKLNFVKESTLLIQEEVGRVKEKIQALNPTAYVYQERTFTAHHKLHMTMVDEKVANAVTGTACSQNCYICGAKPSVMNDLSKVLNLKPNKEAYSLGVSPLHCKIRSFEYFLHISYMLDINKFQPRGKEEKNSDSVRKIMIKKGFRDSMGLVIDQRKHGFGSSNDGNTARRFFEDHTQTASITGLDDGLLQRFDTLLRALATPYEINLTAFEEYQRETARKLVSTYPWYPMSPTVHKLLVHATDIIRAAPLPIGMFSEEAQEARNKDCKRLRTFHRRKMNKIICNGDLLNSLLISSDPLISSFKKVRRAGRRNLPTAVLNLYKAPEFSDDNILFQDSSSEEHEED